LATPRAYRYVRLIGAKHNRVAEIEYIVQPE
jgi:hypothetical protein